MNIGLSEVNDGRGPDYGQVGHLHDSTQGQIIAGIFEEYTYKFRPGATVGKNTKVLIMNTAIEW